jgi:glycosyltransferase involved in cell wall biosynthesis
LRDGHAKPFGQAQTEVLQQRRLRTIRRAAALETAVAEAEGRSAALSAALDERTVQLTEAQERIAALEAAVKEAEQRAAGLGTMLNQSTAELTGARDRAAALGRSLAERERELAHYKQRIAEIKASVSWRLTAPFRELYRPIRRLRSSRFGVNLRAAWRHPRDARKRRLYRANHIERRPPPRMPRARPTKLAAKLRRACEQVPGTREGMHVIYDAEALFTEREALRRKLFGIAWNDGAHRKELNKELALMDGAAAVVAVSNREAEVISRRVRSKVHVIGHKRTPKPYPTSWDLRKDILFVGALTGSRQHSPNIDGLCWFIEEIMPILDPKIGAGYRLIAAGRYESDEVGALGNDRVAILGLVDDLGNLYAQSRLFIAPTRFAAGIPFKVHEASAVGIPIVATSLIAAQADRTHEKDILVGDDAQTFADCCARLYQDRTLWEQLQTAAVASVARECAPDRFDAAVADLLCGG